MTKQIARRWGKLSVLVLVLGALLLPSIFVQAQQGEQTGPYLTWGDAPVTEPMRHEGDAQVRWGLETADKVLGPFFHEPFQVGDHTVFNLGDSSLDEYEFELLYRSEHAYFWFEIGYQVDEAQLEATAQQFDTEFWDLLRFIYGENATPGIDGDTRIHIVNMEAYIGGLAGFFSPDDQCAREICAGSNERDAIYLMLDYGPLGSDQYFATLVHEFQHMIQFNVDGNEYRWMNEGLSQLAEHLSGYSDDPINAENMTSYLSNPNHAIDRWSYSGGQAAYYGGGYLVNVYLYDRFGIEFIQELTQNQQDGLAGIQNTLELTGQDVSVDEVMRDWWIANYLDNPYVSEGDYYYQTLDMPQLPATVQVSWLDGSVEHLGLLHQYGADYLEVNVEGTYTLDFSGDGETPLVLTGTHSDDWMWWSYNSTATATALTHTFDLSAVDGGATLKYWIWGETGDFPGYLHVLASTDGIHWEPIEGVNMEGFSRFSEAPGPHHAGRLDGWQADFIDLGDYVGSEIQVRFEYVTNNAVTGPGFVIDDISIPEIGWSDDVEGQSEGWDADGFLRTQQHVDQNWALVVIHKGDTPTVEIIPVTAGEASAQIDIGDDGAVVLVGAMAPFTQVDAGYRLNLTPIE